MATQTETITSLAQSMKLSNCIQVNINSQFLQMNFQLIKKCLLKVQDLQKGFDECQNSNINLSERVKVVQQNVGSNKSQLNDHQKILKDLQQNLGEQFMKKIEQLQEKIRNTHDIQKLAKQLQSLNIFVTQSHFNQFEKKVEQSLSQIDKLRNELQKYVPLNVFEQFKDQTSRQFKDTQANINTVKDDIKNIYKILAQMDQKVAKAIRQVEENNMMMKQINFNDMQLKLKKYKEDTDNKLNEFLIKLKKKVGVNDLMEIEKTIVQKIDKYLSNQKSKADKEQTKEALSFLEKRINQIFQQFLADQNKQENDPLFATKKWMCASCSKDLGKFEGKLNQFKPWSVFPCKQMDPEKIGGYGYLNYVDKMAYKRGFSIDDTNMERLNKTFYERNRDSPKKMNSTRTTNFMSNYGTNEKNASSLKEEYFKASEKGEKGAKFFRVKKQFKRDNEQQKEKVKQI